LWASKVDLARTMGDLKLISKDWMYKNVFNFSDDDVEDMKKGLVKDAKNTFVLTNLETTGKPEGQQEQGGMMGGQPEMGGEEQPEEEQPEDEFPTGEPMDVEKTIQDLKSKLGQSPNEAKASGRPRDVNRMGKDDHMYGRDAFGDKELKKLSRNNESFIKSIKKSLKSGGAKVILEGKSMMDEQNIIE
jgi:hypothetical protein